MAIEGFPWAGADRRDIAGGERGEKGGDRAVVTVAVVDQRRVRSARVGIEDDAGDVGVGTEVVHGDLATVRLDAAVGAEEAGLAVAHFGERGDRMSRGHTVAVLQRDDLVIDDVVVAGINTSAVWAVA